MTVPLHAKHIGLDVTGDRALVPTARVNLLPPEIEVGRRVRKVKRRVGVVLVAILVIAVGSFGWSRYDESRVAAALEAEQATLLSLRVQQQQYALLPQIQITTARIDESLARLMTNDVAWDRYLEALAATAPPGVRMTNIEIVMVDITDLTAGGGEAVLPGDLDTSGQEHIGVLTVSGESPDRESVAAWSDSLSSVDGFLVPYLLGSRVIAGTGMLEFSIEVTLSSAVRSQAYVAVAPAGAAPISDGDAG